MLFFFSSRRRHTRWNCDWSSDVCSSDLAGRLGGSERVGRSPGGGGRRRSLGGGRRPERAGSRTRAASWGPARSEEHTSEFQSQFHLVCRLLLEKKKKKKRK